MKEIATMILFLLMFTPNIIVPNKVFAVTGLEEVEFSTEQKSILSVKNLFLSSVILAVLGVVYHRVPWFHSLITKSLAAFGYMFKNTLLLASYYVLPDRDR